MRKCETGLQGNREKKLDLPGGDKKDPPALRAFVIKPWSTKNHAYSEKWGWEKYFPRNFLVLRLGWWIAILNKARVSE